LAFASRVFNHKDTKSTKEGEERIFTQRRKGAKKEKYFRVKEKN
jgi:hypothetical protein